MIRPTCRSSKRFGVGEGIIARWAGSHEKGSCGHLIARWAGSYEKGSCGHLIARWAGSYEKGSCGHLIARWAGSYDSKHNRGSPPSGRYALLAMLLLSVFAEAHRMPGSLSTIKKNPHTGGIEVIHRLHNHDAELGIITILKDRSISLEQLVGRAHLALYVEERFRLATIDDGTVAAPLELELIGAELDGEFILVYQELTGELPARIAVRDDILRDVFPDQVNHVNIVVDGSVHSLTFQEDDEWHLATLD